MSSEGSLRALDLHGGLRTLFARAEPIVVLDIGRDGRLLAVQPNRRLGTAVFDRKTSMTTDLSIGDFSKPEDVRADGSAVLLRTDSGSSLAATFHLAMADGSPPKIVATGLCAAFGPEGSVLVASLVAGTSTSVPLNLVSGPDYAAVRPMPPLDLAVSRLRVSADGKRLLIEGAKKDRPLRLWVRPMEGGPLAPISPEGMALRHLVTSPDGLRAASVTAGGEMQVYGLSDEQAASIHSEPGEVPVGWRGDDWLLVGGYVLPVSPITSIRLSTGEREPWMKLAPAAAGVTTIIRPWSAASGMRIFYTYASFTAHLFQVSGVR
jgi:hypothetical protein